MEHPNEARQGSEDGHWGIVSTALMGALAGYLLITPTGRRLCDSAIQLLDHFSAECERFSQATTRAQIAAVNSWRAIETSFGASSGRRAGR